MFPADKYCPGGGGGAGSEATCGGWWLRRRPRGPPSASATSPSPLAGFGPRSHQPLASPFSSGSEPLPTFSRPSGLLLSQHDRDSFQRQLCPSPLGMSVPLLRALTSPSLHFHAHPKRAGYLPAVLCEASSASAQTSTFPMIGEEKKKHVSFALKIPSLTG